ncbi:hypothetical protein ABL840_15675 [Variovorax sp. NFACC27]|uniref:hypothetical protein n=1 Tax=unclassified Variovorax TaxID=663243 RepID=UPI000B8834BB
MGAVVRLAITAGLINPLQPAMQASLKDAPARTNSEMALDRILLVQGTALPRKILSRTLAIGGGTRRWRRRWDWQATDA